MNRLRQIFILTILFTINTFSFCLEALNFVTISGTYNKPDSYSNVKTIKWESDCPGEYVEIVVHGKIINFEVLEMEWNNGSLFERTQKYFIEVVENNTIILSTVLVEGIPSEKIKWMDTKGNEYEYLISDYNSGIGPETYTFNIK